MGLLVGHSIRSLSIHPVAVLARPAGPALHKDWVPRQRSVQQGDIPGKEELQTELGKAGQESLQSLGKKEISKYCHIFTGRKHSPCGSAGQTDQIATYT